MGGSISVLVSHLTSLDVYYHNVLATTAELPISHTVGLRHNFCCRGLILIPRTDSKSSRKTTCVNVLKKSENRNQKNCRIEKTRLRMPQQAGKFPFFRKK